MEDKSKQQATQPPAKSGDAQQTTPPSTAVAGGTSTSSPSSNAQGGVTISNCSHHCNHPTCCYPAKPPAKKKVVGFKKAAPALTSAEIERMIDLGLGRGIDATNAKPWANKTAFQVRRVIAEGVLGTEEGGSLQSYEREVASVVSHQTNLKASIVVPQSPVQIGMDAEQSRSVSSTRRTLGKVVINRSVSFLSDFNDVPVFNKETLVESVRDLTPRLLPVSSEPPKQLQDAGEVAQEGAKDSSVADVYRDFLTFEQRLSKWIVKRILVRQELMAQENRAAGKTVGEPKFVVDSAFAVDPTSTFSHFVYISNEDERKKIIHDCYDFVKHFRITHYVSTIMLGAMEYRLFSETDFNSTVGAGGTLGIEKLVDLSLSHKRTSRKFRKASDVKTIGKISTEGKVGRGTHDEAVVGIRVQPISTLVKFPYLQLALQRSLVHYMEEQGDTSSGPFLVAFGSERSLRYWTVSENYEVFGTSNCQNASLFFIISSDSGRHPYEFHIAYKGDSRHVLRKRVSSLTPASQKAVEAIPRYLDAEVNVFGSNQGPLRLVYHVSERSRLLLFGRIANEKGPISPGTWTQGRDMFFINCARRTMKRDGYIGMRRRRRNGEEEWWSSCWPRQGHHNDRSRFLLFRLLPASLRDDPSLLPNAEPNSKAGPNGAGDHPNPFEDFDAKSLDEQLERYGRGSVPEAFRAPPSPIPPLNGRKQRPPPSDSEEDTLAVPELTNLQFPLLGPGTAAQPTAEATSRV